MDFPKSRKTSFRARTHKTGERNTRRHERRRRRQRRRRRRERTATTKKRRDFFVALQVSLFVRAREKDGRGSADWIFYSPPRKQFCWERERERERERGRKKRRSSRREEEEEEEEEERCNDDGEFRANARGVLCDGRRNREESFSIRKQEQERDQNRPRV